MPRKRDVESRSKTNFFLIGATLTIGLVIATASWMLRDKDEWWSAMLTNIAVVALLLAPGEYLLARLRSSFARVKKAVDQAQVTADFAKKTAEDAARSLEDVRQTLIARQRNEHESELDIYRNMTRVPSRETMLHGLRHATESYVITSAGVRSPVWETSLHYRYLVDKPSVLEVRLETDDGEVISSHRWHDGTSAEDFYQELVLAVRHAGSDLGVGLNDPTESVQSLSEMLIEVTQLRSQELLGHRYSLRLIIERIDGWYYTEEHVVPADDLHYTIGIGRLDEVDWEEHLRLKGWRGAGTAIAFARRMYKTSELPTQSASGS
ncbi:hypothetical protein [Micromonospora violae]|nr:hypothetical protein [Micromonospora violae]